MMFIIPSHTFAGDIVIFMSDNESPMARMESEYEKILNYLNLVLQDRILLILVLLGPYIINRCVAGTVNY